KEYDSYNTIGNALRGGDDRGCSPCSGNLGEISSAYPPAGCTPEHPQTGQPLSRRSHLPKAPAWEIDEATHTPAVLSFLGWKRSQDGATLHAAAKQRDLKKLWYNEAAEDYEWVPFSLKTLEKVWKEEEAGGGVRSAAEQAAHLIRFLKFDPEMFTRNSHNCMSVGLSAKCVSRSACRICHSAMGKLEANNQPPSGEIETYAELAYVMNDFLDIMNGVYGVSTVELKKGENKKKGWITGADSPQLERLLEILDFFSSWQISLQASFDKREWPNHFITDMSWFDMRTTILGFVALSRYVFADEDLVKGKDGGASRFLYPRMFSQDILEHRFAHIRAGMGTHKAPTSVQAIEAGRHGDTIRLSHGGRRRNASRSAGKPFEIQGRVQSMRLALPVNAPEREEVVR
ncbi:unnamed protein product, partial [Ectocarpus sp. 6 AP-2014]